MHIWKVNNNKKRYNDVITKNKPKIWTSAKPIKLYIIRKVLTRGVQKCSFSWMRATMSKVMGIFV